MLKAFVFALGVSTLAASSLLSSPAGAADDMMAAKIDCTKAGSMMADASKMGTMIVMTGDIDKDFTAMVVEHEKGTNEMMKVEAACGKDPKMKAMATKAASDSDDRMAMFRNTNMSQ